MNQHQDCKHNLDWKYIIDQLETLEKELQVQRQKSQKMIISYEITLTRLQEENKMLIKMVSQNQNRQLEIVKQELDSIIFTVTDLRQQLNYKQIKIARLMEQLQQSKEAKDILSNKQKLRIEQLQMERLQANQVYEKYIKQLTQSFKEIANKEFQKLSGSLQKQKHKNKKLIKNIKELKARFSIYQTEVEQQFQIALTNFQNVLNRFEVQVATKEIIIQQIKDNSRRRRSSSN